MQERDHLEDQAQYMNMWVENINVIVNKIGRQGLDWSGSRREIVVASCICNNEPLGSLKVGCFLGYLITY